MEFTKMSGAGNDFIILNNLSGQLAGYRLPQLARTLCDRRFSIGADGMMVIVPAKQGGDFAMLFFNSDGTLSEMCGNGARCICRYGFEHGLSGEKQRVETSAGMVTGWRLSKDVYRIALNTPTELKPNFCATIDGQNYPCAYVELGYPGIPHAVVSVPGLSDLDFDELRPFAAKLRRYRAFQKGANVNLYDIIAPDTVLVKTFERGVEDFTLACGTGAGSTVAVLRALEKVSDQPVRVLVPGGELQVQALSNDGKITALYLTGSAKLICNGVVCDDLDALKAD